MERKNGTDGSYCHDLTSEAAMKKKRMWSWGRRERSDEVTWAFSRRVRASSERTLHSLLQIIHEASLRSIHKGFSLPRNKAKPVL